MSNLIQKFRGHVVVVAGAIIWDNYLRVPSVERASVEKMAFPLPDKLRPMPKPILSEILPSWSIESGFCAWQGLNELACFS
jgi:hypothetical protein